MRRDCDLEPARGAAATLSGAPLWWPVVVIVGAACTSPASAPTADPGQAVPGLPAGLLVRFEAGQALFNSVFRPEQGLGPTFNENQCSACHTSPASGGFGGERILRASRFDVTGCDPLSGHGGPNVRRKATAAAVAAGVRVESLPPGSTPGRFTAPPLFGIGFLAAVDSAELLAAEDPDDRDGDGISGRVGRLATGELARFGRKADVASLAAFVRLAAHQEMGLTTAEHPVDMVAGRPADGGDSAMAPELDAQAVALLTDYVRLLAPTARGAPPAGWTEAEVRRGEGLFGEIGCAACHTPSLTTGHSDVATLDRKRIGLYSDLLLHDMGPALADVCAPGAGPSEVRTEPLMGLRLRDLLLHDGRTTDLETAIRTHGGEAEGSRRAFEQLAARPRAELLAFLKTL